MNEQQNVEPKKPWLAQVGTFFAWSGGFAGATAVALTIIWLIVNLFTRGASLTLTKLSDWMFWGAAALLLIGLVAPNEPDQDSSSDEKKRSTTAKNPLPSATSRSASKTAADDEKDEPSDRLSRFEERRHKAMRKRIARVYNPWRWRFWMSALITFGVSVLFGILG